MLKFISLLFSANGSQFFFTLSETPELNGQATLFGRVVGDTIFNLLRMSELEIDPKTEFPLFPPQIINTEVVINPFNDIIPRERVPKDMTKSNEKTDCNPLKKKNFSLLSFSEPEKELDPTKTKSQNFNRPQSIVQENTQTKTSSNEYSQFSSLQFLQQMKAIQMKETEKKINSIEMELGLRTVEKYDNETNSSEQSQKTEKKLSALEKYKMKYTEGIKRKPEIDSNDEMGTLLMLNSFRQKIQKTGTVCESKNARKEATTKHLDICKLHGLLNCLSCKNTFNVNLNSETADFDEKDWLMHKLVFDRRELEGQVREDLKELVVIDPREQAEKLNKNKNK